MTQPAITEPLCRGLYQHRAASFFCVHTKSAIVLLAVQYFRGSGIEEKKKKFDHFRGTGGD